MKTNLIPGRISSEDTGGRLSLPFYFLLVDNVNLFQFTCGKDIMVLLTVGCCDTLNFCHYSLRLAQ